MTITIKNDVRVTQNDWVDLIALGGYDKTNIKLQNKTTRPVLMVVSGSKPSSSFTGGDILGSYKDIYAQQQYDQVTNLWVRAQDLPALISVTYGIPLISELSDVAVTGDYDDLVNTPTISKVGISNNYNDLDGLPVIPHTAAEIGAQPAEAGKGLSSNDYTTAEKTKLANLSNNGNTDPALNARVTTAEGKIAVIEGKQVTDEGKISTLENRTTVAENSLTNKVDKVSGFGLSQSNFTAAEKAKLAGIEGSMYRGTFSTLQALQSGVVNPLAGNYAHVDVAGADAVMYIWDVSDSAWIRSTSEATQVTAAQVKSLYESNPDTNAFTSAEKTKLSNTPDDITGKLAAKVDAISGKGLSTNDYTSIEKTKLANTPDDIVGKLAAKVDAVSGKVLSSNDYTNVDKLKLDNTPDDITGKLAAKVDTVAGKGLSTNDYTTTDKAKVGNVPADTNAALLSKVDAVNGKGLSTNDFTTTEKNKLANVPADTNAALLNKVDAVNGKVLSTNDFTTIEKNKLANVPSDTGAALLAKVDTVSGKGLSTNDYTTAEKNKLGGIADGATANSSDTALVSRANHTGTQAIATIDNLQTTLSNLAQATTDLTTRANALALNNTDVIITPWADSRGAQNWSNSTTPAAPLSRSPLWRMEAKGQMVRVRYDQMQSVSGDSVAQLLNRINTDTAPTGITIKPSQVPPGIAWVQIGTNSVNAGVPLGAQGVPGTLMGDIHSILDFLVAKGHRVMLLAEWPRGNTSSNSGLLTPDNQKLMYTLHNALLKVKRKNVWIVDVWPRMADPARLDAAPLANFLNNDDLHQSIGAGEVTAQEAVRIQKDEMHLTRMKITTASNGDIYDAVLNPRGCLNTNPMLVQGAGGTVTPGTAYDGTVAATGVAPEGYTLAASAGLKVVGSFGNVTLPNGDTRPAFLMTISGRATSANGYVSLRQSGLISKVAVGDVLEANYECLVTNPNPNFSSPSIMIDTGLAATRAYGGLSITNDKQMPVSIIRTSEYLVPQSAQLSLATLPTSLSFEMRPCFVLGGAYSATAGSDLSVDSSVTIAILSCGLRKV